MQDPVKKTELTVVEQPQTLMRPQVSPDDLISYHKELTDLVSKALVLGTDYGKIPGAGDRPTLLKPGAERIAVAFGVSINYEVTEREAEHDRKVEWRKRQKKWNNAFKGDHSFTWAETTGESLGLYRYVVRCDLMNRKTGIIAGSGIGCCSTMESKYVDRPRDTENTVLKMAQKRALVAAVLNTFGLSDRFTQDVEDYDHVTGEVNEFKPEARAEKQKAAQTKADAQGKAGKPIPELDRIYNKAKAKGVPLDFFQGWRKDLKVGDKPEKQTAEGLKELEAKVDSYVVPDPEPPPMDDVQDEPREPGQDE